MHVNKLQHPDILMDDNTLAAAVSPASVLSESELRELVQRISASGALGRSKVYGQLLEYLLNATLAGRSPKEVEIALDVLGRDSSFEVARDSVVRVYVHQLRKRLDTYYETHEPDAPWRIVILRGQYTVAAVPLTAGSGQDPEAAELTASSAQRRWWLPVLGIMSLAIVVLLALLLRQPDAAVSPASAHPMWEAILDDNLPVMLVMGDYYIFGEQDTDGRITRMIRDFNVNSREDLNRRFVEEPGLRDQFVDLNLNYLPEGSALAVARLVPLLQQQGKSVRVTMMSRLLTADLRSHHIVYIGYISALDKLRRLTFAASGLEVGRTYDELFDRETGAIYSSDAGLPAPDQPFRDYGLLSSFPAPAGNQIVIVAGTRDAALMHTAQVATDAQSLNEIEPAALNANGDVGFEALYEVIGIERTNFDAALVYARALDVQRIWSSEPAIN